MGFQGSVQAAGFALIEMNASGQGNSYAGAAAATRDASTIFFNPAGMMNFEGDQLVVIGHIIDPSSDFNNDGSSLAPLVGGGPISGDDDDGGSAAFVPNLYWTKTLSDDMKFGLGLNAPFGLATKYDEDWVGRYHAVESDLATYNINPSIAYRASDSFVIGGGLNFMLADVTLTNAIDMASLCIALAAGCGGAAPESLDGFADLEGDNFDDFGYGFNLGVMFHASEDTKIGIAYRSEVEINVEGEADFTAPTTNPILNGTLAVSGLFEDTDLEATVDLPASLSASLAHTTGKFTWLFDITRTYWSSYEELRIEYDNPAQPDSVTTNDWEDVNRYSIGLDYQYSDKMILRTGIALDETPVPSAERRTPRLPGDDRTWISFGLTYLYSPEMTLDFAFTHVMVDDAEINNEFESSVPTLQHTLTGEYEADVNILSAQLTWMLE